MHGFWNFFVHRRQFTFLLIGALVAGGLASVIAIPKESAPEVQVPIAIVATPLRGGSAEDVATLISKKIEKEVATVSNIDTVSSTSREGISIVVAEFEASANIDKSIQDVKDAVDRAKPELPRDADEPAVSRVNFADQPVLIISLSGGIPPAEFTRLADDAKEVVELIPGVARVDTSGTRAREASVVIEREALSSFGLTFGGVIGAIAASNASVPVGALTVDRIEYAVAFDGDLADPEDLAGIAVGQTGGRTVYLRDVATIVNGIERATTISRVSLDGEPAEPAITLYVYKKAGANIITTTDAVEKRLAELSENVLAGTTPFTVYSAGEEVKTSLSELTRVGLETTVLVMLCLFAALGWRESLIAGLAIPLSFVIAFIGLAASGNTVNFVSLFALILAIGILVDSGIVVVEAIHTRYRRFGDAVMAARETIREYSWPLIAGTMTTVAVFVPLFFISGVTGQFIASIPFTIIFVLIASVFVALGLLPLIAVVASKRSMSGFEAWQERMNERVHEWYRMWLAKVLKDRVFQRWFLRGIAAAFVVALALPMLGVVKVIFFPGDDVELLYVEIEEKQGTPLLQTDLAARAVEEILYEDHRIESFTTTVGASSAFGGGTIGGSTGGAKLANISINLVPKEDREATSADIVEELREKASAFRTFKVRVFEPQNGPPSGAPILITFSGENLDDLDRSVDIGERVLSDIEGATEITTSNKDDGLKFALSIDRAKTAAVGLTPLEVASVLRTAVSGSVATTIVEDETDIDVFVTANLNPAWRDVSETAEGTADSLTNLSIQTPRGSVLLGSLLTASVQSSNAVVSRENQKNVGTISSYVREGVTAGEVSKAFTDAMADEELPAGIAMKVGGETEDVDQSFRDMFIALIAGMILMLAILVLEFNSFRYAGLLLMLVPLSLIGVLGGLALTGLPLSFPSLLGVIALAGVIINHAIILIDSIIVRMKAARLSGQNRTLEEVSGALASSSLGNHESELSRSPSLEEVIIDASESRLRPIVLTTVTTVVGMIPLAAASALWGPLAYTIMFGLTFAMILTLVLTPILVYRKPGKEYWGEEKREPPVR